MYFLKKIMNCGGKYEAKQRLGRISVSKDWWSGKLQDKDGSKNYSGGNVLYLSKWNMGIDRNINSRFLLLSGKAQR